MTNSFASCCLLSYNRPKFVREAIVSLVENAGAPLELLVHDDGSDSETVNALLDMRGEGMISLLMLNAEGNNEGQGIGLNRMFHAAKGDPIIKLDHDLIFQKDWLKTSLKILKENTTKAVHKAGSPPRIGALGLFHYHTEPVVSSRMFVNSWGNRGGQEDIEGYEEHTDFVGSAMVIPRAAWKRFGPFEERSEAFAEDHAFKMKVTNDPNWCCALPHDDLAINQGFGLGPSTVVTTDDEGKLTSSAIAGGPRIVNS